MKEIYEDIAYDAVIQLSQELNHLELQDALETVIEQIKQGTDPSFYESIEKAGLAVAIAALILQAASLGVDIYSLRSEEQSSLQKIEELEMEIRRRVTSNKCISLEQKDRIIQVVTEVIVQKAPVLKTTSAEETTNQKPSSSTSP